MERRRVVFFCSFLSLFATSLFFSNSISTKTQVRQGACVASLSSFFRSRARGDRRGRGGPRFGAREGRRRAEAGGTISLSVDEASAAAVRGGAPFFFGAAARSRRTASRLCPRRSRERHLESALLSFDALARRKGEGIAPGLLESGLERTTSPLSSSFCRQSDRTLLPWHTRCLRPLRASPPAPPCIAVARDIRSIIARA